MEANTKIWLMVLSVGLLLVVSVVQAVELLGINSAAGSFTGEVKATPKASGTSSGGSGQTLQKSLDDLQGMVGGC